jgi:hypothetical protein
MGMGGIGGIDGMGAEIHDCRGTGGCPSAVLPLSLLTFNPMLRPTQCVDA